MSEEDRVQPRSVVAVYSGGMDSTVLLFQMLASGVDVKGALSIDYGQKHAKELQHARKICEAAGVPHRIADLTAMAGLFGESSLTNAALAIPEGHYEEDNMKSTVVPNRNMILLSIATAWAISLKAEAVAYAAHSGDHAIYPDCREAFAKALDAAIRLCDWQEVRLYRPYVGLSKADIVRLGASLGAPLAETWSCYKGGELHCGRCGTCVERREAFYLAGVPDGTVYEASAPALEDLIKSGWKL